MASTSKFPEKFGKSGRDLWGEIEGKYSLNVPEKLILLQACRAADRLDEIQNEMQGQPYIVQARQQPIVQPLVVEQRLLSASLAKLIAGLRIPDAELEQAVSRPQHRGGARGSYATNPGALTLVPNAG